MKGSGIGGQAVMEGVMMKNGEKYAVAVRKPDGEITVDVQNHKAIGAMFSKVPIVRGVVAFIDSLVLGIRTLTYSSSFYEEEEEPSEKKELTEEDLKKKDRQDKAIMTGTVCLSVVFAVGIFMLLPYFLSQLLKNVISSAALLALLEGVIRVALFIGYVAAISLMKDIKRVFMYHGAEHKSINCIEHGLELTVENVRGQSRQHKRCGTSFLLIVMLISVVLFMFIRVDNAWLRVLVRLLLIPVIAGVAYEFIKLAGRTDNRFVDILSKPGLALQNLTTREPDDSMIECAIASVEAVFDWKDFLVHYNDTEVKSKMAPAEESKSDEIGLKADEAETKAEEPVEAPEEKPKKPAKKKAVKKAEEKPVEEPKTQAAEVKVEAEPEVKVEVKPEVKVAEPQKKFDPFADEDDNINLDDEPFIRRMKEKEAALAAAKEESPKKKAASKKKAEAEKAKEEKAKEEKVKEEFKEEIISADEELASTERIDLMNPTPVDDDEDDEILRALDQFFILKQKKDNEEK